MDFIFMLTRDDRTVEDCLALFDLVRPIGLRHVGFKDVGVEPAILSKLTGAIRAAGAVSYMEVVSEDPQDMLRSARIAREVGVDCLMGGTAAEQMLEILEGSSTRLYPFPGRPFGLPTRLGGSPALVEAQCRTLMETGCAGAVLLAYRATEAEPLDLVKAARRGIGKNGYLIVAGSVGSRERIAAVQKAGADAFTIGTAIFEGSYDRRKGSILSQLEAVLNDCRIEAGEMAG